MNGPIAKTLLVVVLGFTLTIHTFFESQLLYAATPNVRPKAIVVMDNLINATLVSPFGRTAAVAVMAIATVLCAVLAYHRQTAEAAARSHEEIAA